MEYGNGTSQNDFAKKAEILSEYFHSVSSPKKPFNFHKIPVGYSTLTYFDTSKSKTWTVFWNLIFGEQEYQIGTLKHFCQILFKHDTCTPCDAQEQ